VPGRYQQEEQIVDINTAGTARRSAGTQVYQERCYPQFDCVGSYLWIWERLVQRGNAMEVVARQVHRYPLPDSCDAT
jgi:hypothetical protein